MDPLAHTLVGANLASTSLGARTRLATAACLIGANVPDVDVLAYALGEDFAIGFRRGWTHGLPAQLLLPVVLWLALLGWDRFISGRYGPGDEPLQPKWLLFLCFLSVLTHPFLDWLNTYGMRWLMPFDGTWFYGDAVFIMDPWLWLILASAWLVPRAPGSRLVTVWAVFSVLLALAVGGRASGYLPLIGAISAILLLALLWKPRGETHKHRLAFVGLTIAGIYIASMLTLHVVTSKRVNDELAAQGIVAEELLVGPLPVDSLSWDVLVKRHDHYRFGTWSWWDRSLELSQTHLPRPYDSSLWTAAKRDPSITGFMTWVRYPWMATLPEEEGGTRVYILDARYNRDGSPGFGGTSVVVGD